MVFFMDQIAAIAAQAGVDVSGALRVIDSPEIQSIANEVVGGAFDRLETATATFRALEEGAGVFGGSGPGAEIASLHSGIKGVFATTNEGVGADLDTMRTNLAQSAANWEQADLTAAERSNAICTQIEAGTTTLATATSYDQAREDAGVALVTGDELAQRLDEMRAEQEVTGADAAPEVAGDGGPEAASAPAPAAPATTGDGGSGL